MSCPFLQSARIALESRSPGPIYQRLAEGLARSLLTHDREALPSARALAAGLGVNRATVTAAYRELARRGLIVLRPGRPGRGRARATTAPPEAFAEPPAATLDLARYVPDSTLLPATALPRWLGLGDAEGEAVAQYGDPWGWRPLREWLAERLSGWGLDHPRVLLTGGVQHGLDLLLRALVRPGDTVLVEDPTYPGLPPLLSIHGVTAVGVAMERQGLTVEAVREAVRRTGPRLAILTPTLHNPSGTVLGSSARRAVLRELRSNGTLVVEELFEPGLVDGGGSPPPMAALDGEVVAVGSFSKVLFPGLRVGWMTGPLDVLERVAAVKRATDLCGSSFLEATALALSNRGELDAQIGRLREVARERRAIVLEELGSCPPGVAWSDPRGGFSVALALPEGWSARAVAARAADAGVWVLPGPLMSVSGRDDVMRLAYAAAGGDELRRGVRRFVAALSERRMSVALV